MSWTKAKWIKLIQNAFQKFWYTGNLWYSCLDVTLIQVHVLTLAVFVSFWFFHICIKSGTSIFFSIKQFILQNRCEITIWKSELGNNGNDLYNERNWHLNRKPLILHVQIYSEISLKWLIFLSFSHINFSCSFWSIVECAAWC